MTNLKQIEKLMMLPSRSENPEYCLAFELMLMNYNFRDEQNFTNHSKIINLLYNVKAKNYTLISIAEKMNISDNALRRYRTEYAAFFFYLVKQLHNRKLTAIARRI